MLGEGATKLLNTHEVLYGMNMFRDESIQPVCRFWNQTKRLRVPCRICAHHKERIPIRRWVANEISSSVWYRSLKKQERPGEEVHIFTLTFFLNYGQCLCAQMKRYTPNDLDSCRN